MSDQSDATARPWRWLAAAAVVGNVALNGYANLHPFNGQSMAVVSAKYPTLLTPSGYAFSIWGVIFLGMLLYAGWQLLPAQAAHPLPDRVARPLALTSLATAAWVVAFSYEQLTASVALMLGILLGLVLGYGRVRQAVLAKTAPWWVSVPFALYLGWISVAAAINVTIGLQRLGVQFGEELTFIIACGVLLALAGLTLAVAGSFRDLLFLAAPAWALVGIWVAQVHDRPALGWAALAAAVALALLGFALVRQRSKLQPWQVATAAAEAETQRLRANA